MATIYIENIPYEVSDRENLLETCLSLGFNVPYFCWHPAMGSVGACRLCAVKQYKDENDTHGQLVMSCMTQVRDGMRISIEDEEARKFRKAVLEWLMINHPHDCPVCDEGGECHLQDMTVMTGHVYRNYRFSKRTYRNQYLGPFINHEMNRCIQCYRCVRFYKDIAGGRDLDVFGSRDRLYFGRQQSGRLENEFSGNLVEICPTGVFTDKTLKNHYTRKWDLQTAPSICVHCGVGCNTIPGERYGTLRRIRNRYNSEVNRYFLCDRGRYGYEFVNSPKRIRTPQQRLENGNLHAVDTEEALAATASILSNSKRIIGIGSPRASLESNFALMRLVGKSSFCSGHSEKENGLLTKMLTILSEGPARSPSLHDIEQSDAVFILGEDLTNIAPMMALAVRQSTMNKPKSILNTLHIPDWQDAAVREAIQDKRGPLFIAGYDTKLADVATRVYRGAPQDIARLGFAVAHEIDSSFASVPDVDNEMSSLAQGIDHRLRDSERPVIISGPSLGSEKIIEAAANVAGALCNQEKNTTLAFTAPECNSLGVTILDAMSIEKAAEQIDNGEADTVIILENDLYRRTDVEMADRLFEKANVISLDHFEHLGISRSHIVLPAATFAEATGTFVNNEKRAQRFYQVFVPEAGIQASWRWLVGLLRRTGRGSLADLNTIDDVCTALGKEITFFESLSRLAPQADFRVAGQKIPRQQHRYSGRTAIRADVDIHEPKPPDDSDTPLSFSMEGYPGQPPSSLVHEYWSPGWNSVQSLNKFQEEVGGPLRGGDPGQRLIEPDSARTFSPFTEIPGAFRLSSEEYLLIPLYHIFGSEEMSAYSSGIRELSPDPYFAFSRKDAELRHIEEGQRITLNVNDRDLTLKAVLVDWLTKGLIGVPVGLSGIERIPFPARATIVQILDKG